MAMLLPAFGVILLLAAFVAAYRWIRARSHAIAFVFAAAVIVRVGAGVLLNGAAAFDLPFFESLRYPDGVWEFAPDARTYQRAATLLSREGFDQLTPAMPAPTYIVVLTLWMELVGTGRAAGFMLNLALFMTLSVLLVRTFAPARGTPGERSAIIAIAALGLTPSVVLHGTQPLKDDFALFLIVASCLAAARLFAPGKPALRRALLAVALAAAVAVLAGVRSHMALMLIVAAACAALVFVAHHVRARADVLRAAGLAVTAVCLSIGGYQLNATSTKVPPVLSAATPPVVAVPQPAPELEPPPAAPVPPPAASEPAFAGLATLPARAVAGIRQSRGGFARSGGGTNLAEPDEMPSLDNDVRGLAIGLAATFVPISLLKATGVVSFDGGQGLLLIADIDTIFLDAIMLASLVLLLRHRRAWTGGWPVVVMTIVYGVCAVLLLSYVVTNYGTLFRMRAMMTASFWLMLLAFAGSRLSVARSERSVGAELAHGGGHPRPAGPACTPGDGTP